MARQHILFARILLHLLCALPLTTLAWEATALQLGSDPAQYIVRELGFWGMTLLWTSLLMTPLRHLSGKVSWVAFRRALGLWSFAYISLHLTAFILFWGGLDPAVVIDEITQRPYILLGVAAWLLMIPLAATSTRGARRRLGRSWLHLHRVVYIIAILGWLHLLLLVKLDYSKPIFFGIALIFLFLIRIKARQRKAAAIECASSA